MLRGGVVLAAGPCGLVIQGLSRGGAGGWGACRLLMPLIRVPILIQLLICTLTLRPGASSSACRLLVAVLRLISVPGLGPSASSGACKLRGGLVERPGTRTGSPGWTS